MGWFSRKPKGLKEIVPKETDDHVAVVFTTSMGSFTATLHHTKAPCTAQNFIDLAEDGFYDGLCFHRVIDGFMLQGGCPKGTGTGGPGYAFADEFARGLSHDAPGILSMANSGPHTNGSQFFVTLAPTPHLNRKHAVFGKVTDGLDVVMAIGDVRTDVSDRPETDVVIERLAVIRR